MIRIPATVELLKAIMPREIQLLDDGLACLDVLDDRVLHECGIVFMEEGHPIGAIVAYPVYEGVVSGMVLLSEELVENHWMAFAFRTRKEIERVMASGQVRRLQAIVMDGAPIARKFAEWLGLECENPEGRPMRNYSVGGLYDCWMYARVA